MQTLFPKRREVTLLVFFWHSVEEYLGPIDELKKVSDIPKEPYNLPPAFEWANIDVNDPEQIQEVYTLLNENYVEDDEAMFR